MTLIEALAASRPVVSTDVGGVVDVVVEAAPASSSRPTTSRPLPIGWHGWPMTRSFVRASGGTAARTCDPGTRSRGSSPTWTRCTRRCSSGAVSQRVAP